MFLKLMWTCPKMFIFMNWVYTLALPWAFDSYLAVEIFCFCELKYSWLYSPEMTTGLYLRPFLFGSYVHAILTKTRFNTVDNGCLFCQVTSSFAVLSLKLCVYLIWPTFIKSFTLSHPPWWLVNSDVLYLQNLSLQGIYFQDCYFSTWVYANLSGIGLLLQVYIICAIWQLTENFKDCDLWL